MSDVAVYQERSPKQLAGPPPVFSYSSLKALRDCPRRWQLQASEWSWGKYYPRRSSVPILRGNTVHKALEELVKRLHRAGSPEFGSSEFRAVAKAFQREKVLEATLREELANFRRGPRSRFLPPPRLRLEECRNALVKLLRASWQPDGPTPVVRKQKQVGETSSQELGRGFSPEVEVRHPGLPLKGTIDLVQEYPTGTVLLDYKTGAVREEHVEQMRLYGLLWWRAKGDLPRRLKVVSPRDEAQILEPTREDLEAYESSLEEELPYHQAALSTGLAQARVAAGRCANCSVRQLCDDYWEATQTRDLRLEQVNATGLEGSTDAQVTIESVRSEFSVRADLSDGNSVTIVAARNAGLNFHGLEQGTRVRFLGLRWEAGQGLVATCWTELFQTCPG